MHSSDPKSYGQNRPGGIPIVTLGTSPMGTLGGPSYGLAELQREEAMVQQTLGTSTGGHPHLWAAGLVTGAIILLFALGLMFPGAVQF
jgi:hypothetical protein